MEVIIVDGNDELHRWVSPREVKRPDCDACSFWYNDRRCDLSTLLRKSPYKPFGSGTANARVYSLFRNLCSNTGGHWEKL